MNPITGIRKWWFRRKGRARSETEAEDHAIILDDLALAYEREALTIGGGAGGAYVDARFVSTAYARLNQKYNRLWIEKTGRRNVPFRFQRTLGTLEKGSGVGKARYTMQINDSVLFRASEYGAGGGRSGNLGFWAIMLGTSGFGKAGKFLANVLKKSVGYLLFIQGLVMFSDFMREETIQTSGFGMFIVSDDPESLTFALQQHLQILRFSIETRWLVWLNINERAFSLFFISAINTYRMYLNKLINLCIAKYWVFSIKARDPNNNIIDAAIYIDNEFQFANTPQETFIPNNISMYHTKVKVTLKKDGFNDYTKRFMLCPIEDYIYLKKRIGPVYLGETTWAVVKPYLRNGTKDVTTKFLPDEFKKIIEGIKLSNVDILNKIVMNTNTIHAVRMNSDGTVLDKNGNPYTFGTGQPDIQLTLIGKFHEKVDNYSIPDTEIAKIIPKVEDIEKKGRDIKLSDDEITNEIYEALIKGTFSYSDVFEKMMAKSLHEAYIETMYDQWGEANGEGKANYLDYLSWWQNKSEDEQIKESKNTITSYTGKKTILEDSPSLEFNGICGTWLLEIAGTISDPLLIQTKGSSQCGTFPADAYDEFKLGIKKEWTFSCLTDTFYIQVLNTDANKDLDTPLDTDKVLIKRDSRLEDMISPMEIYDNIKCGNARTRWIEIDENNDMISNTINADGKIIPATPKKLDFNRSDLGLIDEDWKVGIIEINAQLTPAIYDLHPINLIVTCVDDANILIGGVPTGLTSGKADTITEVQMAYKQQTVTLEKDGVLREKWFDLQGMPAILPGNTYPTITHDGFCNKPEKTGRKEYPIKLIVECVDDAEIWVNELLKGLSGPAGVGIDLNLAYGGYEIKTIWNNIEYIEWMYFDETAKAPEGYTVPVFIQSKYCVEVTHEEQVKFVIVGVTDAAITVDGAYKGTSGKELAYFNIKPSVTHKVRISSPGYYDRVVDFYFDDTTPFLTYPDGTKETIHTFYYNLNDNKVSNYSTQTGRYKMREDFPHLRVNPNNAKISFTDIASHKKYTFRSEQPIDGLPYYRNYIVKVSTKGYDTFSDKLYWEGFFDYPNQMINLKFKTKKNKCIC